jgi:hypothetical protein
MNSAKVLHSHLPIESLTFEGILMIFKKNRKKNVSIEILILIDFENAAIDHLYLNKKSFFRVTKRKKGLGT